MIATDTTFRPSRDDTRAYSDRLRVERTRWNSPTFVAKELATTLANPALVFSPYVASRKEAAAEFVRLHPSAVRLLSAAVIAAATPVRSTCRWCHASQYAKVNKTAPPDPTGYAVRSLLGPPCRHPTSLRAQADAVLARVEPYRREVRARAKSAAFKSLIASGTITERDRQGRPTRLRTRTAVTCGTCGVRGGTPGCGCQIVHPTETPFPTEFPQQTATMTLAPRVRWR
jgi:hypothetical protein